MQEILTKTPAVILDDRVQNVLPLLPLGDAGRVGTQAATPGGATPGAGPGAATPGAGTPVPSLQRSAPR
jgi:hypothetical protein